MECCCINLEKEEGKESAERRGGEKNLIEWLSRKITTRIFFFKFLYTPLLIDLFNLIVKHEHNVWEKKDCVIIMSYDYIVGW